MLNIGTSGFMTILMLVAALVGLGFAWSENGKLHQTVTQLESALADKENQVASMTSRATAAEEAVAVLQQKLAEERQRGDKLQKELEDRGTGGGSSDAGGPATSGGTTGLLPLFGATAVLSATFGGLAATVVTRRSLRREIVVAGDYRRD